MFGINDSQKNLVQFDETSLTCSNSYKTARESVKKEKNSLNLNKKQRSAFNTVYTGFKMANRLNEIIRFMTLTTSDLQYDNIEYENNKLNESFRKFKQIIRRTTPLKLIIEGYIKNDDLRRYYQNKRMNDPLVMEYFKVITNEGNGVVHCVYRGDFIPYNYIVDIWNDVYNSWNVSISKVGNNAKDRIESAFYVVTQYISSQKATFIRNSQSWQWIIRGYRKKWLKFLNECRDRYFYNPVARRFYKKRQEIDIFRIWDQHLYSLMKPPPIQMLLEGFGNA